MITIKRQYTMIFTCKVYVDLIYQSHFHQPIRYAVCILLYSVYDSRRTVYFTGISSSMYMYVWYLFEINISTCKHWSDFESLYIYYIHTYKCMYAWHMVIYNLCFPPKMLNRIQMYAILKVERMTTPCSHKMIKQIRLTWSARHLVWAMDLAREVRNCNLFTSVSSTMKL